MHYRLVPAVLLAGLLLSAMPSPAANDPHPGMIRFPDVSRTHITFRYANNLWLVPREGGTALPIASPPGGELYPRFSPDGKTIAFVGNYDGGTDLYTIPVAGGVPFRVTHHPTSEMLNDWTPDGELLFTGFGIGSHARTREMFRVNAGGGMPQKLPVPYGGVGAISADGEWLAYTPFTRDQRSWKRYRGGMATDIWLFNLKDHSARKVTEWEGTDTSPMWQGEKIYYLSDGGANHRLNIWVYDIRSSERRQVTTHDDYDVKYPSIGPGDSGDGEIVYQIGSELRLLDLTTGSDRIVQITIPGDRPKVRVHAVDASDVIISRNISSTGKRVVVGARGDIWTIPAENGSPVNLTHTSGLAERDPAWSSDGKYVAFFSDKTGSYELYLTGEGGRGEARQLTEMKRGFLFDPEWSPDSEWISFWDNSGTFWIQKASGGEPRRVDKYTDNNGRSTISWSSDSRWIAYTNQETARTPHAIWIYDVKKDVKHRVTAGMFQDTWPTFDREGKYLYFASNREISAPQYSDYGTTWIYSKTDRLYVVPLTDEIKSPLLPESDEEEWGDEKKGDDDGDDDEEDEDDEDGKKKPEPVVVDLEGFERRAVAIPVEPGGFVSLAVNSDDQLVYGRISSRGDQGERAVYLIDLEEDDEDEMEKKVVEGTASFVMSSDGKKLLLFEKGGAMSLVDAESDQEKEPVSTTGMTVMIDPRAEWRQIFTDAWRIHKAYFYDRNMHGVDWEAIRVQYGAMVDYCASREDLSFVIREMIAELNVGHAYYWGGDLEETPDVSVGMLGCDFELHDGAYRISRILEGAPWDVDARGPLSQPGLDVKAGDYVLEVNGIRVAPDNDPWAAFQGLAERTVTLTVSERPTLDDSARRVVVEPLASDSRLRYRAWVEANRAYVEEKTDGRVGYIYVPDTGRRGQSELFRQFIGQLHKNALIIDERWNGGGQIPSRFIELLNRPVESYWAERFSEEAPPWPPDAHHGPKCMLINGLAGSGGDYFPFLFKRAGIGKLIGTRTWGGLVGISGNPRLIDGGYTSVPMFAFFETDGTWGIEGHGVDPDIEVIDDPSLMVDGGDPQLDAAIDHMLSEIERNPFTPPARPAYPDRSGMGITPEDR